VIRIGNGQGFWGDSVDAPMRLVEDGPLDVLTLDYLAEVTMSIMQKLRRRDPEAGYASDFVDLARRLLPRIGSNGVRIVANAGGVNPEACRRAVASVAVAGGRPDLAIGIVSGDDIFARLDEILASGVRLENMDDGRPLSAVRERVLSANVYISSFPVASALAQGADIVLTGRCTDPGLVLAPLIARYGWKEDDWNRLAAGTVAGHIVECGAQCTGGNDSRWWEVHGWDRIGYPVVEGEEDGSFVVTKHAGTGGRVTIGTISEQLLYEMGDPRRYLTPDVTADFTTIRLDEAGPDRVRVSGVRGAPPPPTLKVSIAYLDGWKATGQITVSGPRAIEKARVCADALWGRLKRAGLSYEATETEYVGLDACHGPLTPADAAPGEVVLRVGVRDPDRAKVDRFGKELAPLVTTGPPGVTGFAGGRPKAAEVVSFWPALIPRELVSPSMTVVRAAEVAGALR